MRKYAVKIGFRCLWDGVALFPGINYWRCVKLVLFRGRIISPQKFLALKNLKEKYNCTNLMHDFFLERKKNIKLINSEIKAQRYTQKVMLQIILSVCWLSTLGREYSWYMKLPKATKNPKQLAIRRYPWQLAIEKPPRQLTIEKQPRQLTIEKQPRQLTREKHPRQLAKEKHSRQLPIRNHPGQFRT